MIKTILSKIKEYFVKDELVKISYLNQEIENLLIDKKKLEMNNLIDKEMYERDLEELKRELDVILAENSSLLEQIPQEEELEKFWNNKLPKANLTYRGRVVYSPEGVYLGMAEVNPREFCNYIHTVKFNQTSLDDRAMASLRYVISNIKYISESKEMWQYAYETLLRKGGDCFAGYEEIYTPEGLKKIENIKVGDIILSYDFNKQKYVNKKVIAHWYKGKLPIARVHFRNGQHIDITKNHPMWSRINSKGKSIYNKTYLSDIDLTEWYKRKIPIAKKIPYKKSTPKFHKDLYFVLGHYIAEGFSDKYKVCSSGYELIEHIIPILEKHKVPFSEYKNNGGVPCIRFLKSEFKDYLKLQMTNSFDIHLLEEVITLPQEYLEALLYGMWLGDGTKFQYADKRGYKNNKEWTYSTSCKKLSEDIQRIGLHLGRTFHIWKQDNHKGVGKKPIYRINYNSNSHFMKSFGYKDISEVSISNVEYLEDTDFYDLTVEDTHTVILKNGIITHQCEDGAILLYNILINSGIPYWRVRLNAGNVQGGGHAWITYLRESDNTWYVLDWCYWKEESIKWLKWKDAEKYFDIWFSWNSKYIFRLDDLDRG